MKQFLNSTRWRIGLVPVFTATGTATICMSLILTRQVVIVFCIWVILLGLTLLRASNARKWRDEAKSFVKSDKELLAKIDASLATAQERYEKAKRDNQELLATFELRRTEMVRLVGVFLSYMNLQREVRAGNIDRATAVATFRQDFDELMVKLDQEDPTYWVALSMMNELENLPDYGL